MNKTCNVGDYRLWYETSYDGHHRNAVILSLIAAQRMDKKLWRIMNFDKTRSDFLSGNYLVSNGQAMEMSGIFCRESLAMLKLNLAGKHGPVSDQDIHDEMCDNFCLMGDAMRESGLQASGCSCLQLSLSSNDLAYTIEGDWCRESSGLMLCDELERCGIWQCNMIDIHCKRREYNTLSTLLKGKGDNCSDAYGMLLDMKVYTMTVIISVTLLLKVIDII